MRLFVQRVLGIGIQVFGNVAVAMGARKIIKKGAQVVRGVEALTFVKDDRVWRIAAQAWDTESGVNPVSHRLLAGRM